MVVVGGALLISSLVRSILTGPETTEGVDPTNVQYVNEDYTPPPADLNPPPLPGPKDDAAATPLTQDNPLYFEAIPTPTRCAMGQIDMLSETVPVMEDHLNELMGCLMRVWDDPVSSAGFEMPRPTVTVYADPITTACGTLEEVNAIYCGADQRVYYAQPLLRAFPDDVGATTYAAEMVLAHEFGHAVQARTAILISELVLEQNALTEEDAFDASRRLEMQADCMAGQFINSVAISQELDQDNLARLSDVVYHLGDDVLNDEPGFSADHGTGEARQRWFTAGLESADIGTCNSFTAPASQVR
ncbi:MAG: neutral zinc metallopeptidase [Propioniciclava sp.]